MYSVSIPYLYHADREDAMSALLIKNMPTTHVK